MPAAGKRVLERRYALFVHYGLREGRDWERRGDLGISIFVDRLVDRLIPDLTYLNTLLAHQPAGFHSSWKGFAFIFLDMGWTDLLKGDMRPINAATLAVQVAEAHKEIEHRLNSVLRGDRRVRIVSTANLVKLLALLETLASQNPRQHNAFHEWLTGGGASLRYDGAKVIEGAVRIANIGRQVPVFRFDDDVIFCGRRAYPGDSERWAREIEKTADGIFKLCERYVELSDDPAVNYFVFSGSYGGTLAQPPDTGAQGASEGRVAALLNGFATRVGQMAYLPDSTSGSAFLAKEAPLSAEAAENFLRAMPTFGAHPERQAISGAGLCLSDGAILDLPPFSNMHLNVMWIDDHLKYALHHELGHLGLRTLTPHSARVRGAVFSQLRYRAGDFRYSDVHWHTTTYLRGLMLGCVADAWLRADRRLKGAISRLPAIEREALLAKVPGDYASEFVKVMPNEWSASSDKEQQSFKNRLWRLAVQRLSELVGEWKKDIYHNTFLGLFVAGKQHERYDEFREFIPSAMREGLRAAVSELAAYEACPHFDIDRDRLDELSLAQAVTVLIDDFVGYFDLVLFWKNFVQSVRFLLNQERASRKALQWLVPFESDVGFSDDVIDPRIT